jgi:hypothetical protein
LYPHVAPDYLISKSGGRPKHSFVVTLQNDYSLHNSIIMKTITFLILFLTATTFIENRVYAQQSAIPTSVYTAGKIYETFNEQNLLKPVKVNVRAARDFIKRFRQEQVNWYAKNDTSFAKFSNDSITTIAGYGKNGKWLYTVKNFSERLLPANLRHSVRSQYYDYKINIIYELQFPSNHEKVYIIYLYDLSGNHKIIRIYNDDITVVRQSGR